MKYALVFVGALAAGITSAQAEGDAANGEKLFKRCAACHTIGEGAKNRVGPQLNGIVGRQIAAVDGFKYSKAFKAKKEAEPDFVWSVENLDGFLTKPKKFIKRTKMSFPGLKKEAQRADMIAYLKTFNADGSAAE
ncbi:c-type cytochrome [Coralliovum pocilloporae]|uniref:c-type cytochrome n=1 Tax=Coralliovum pocilloporae TaxID=3066369 RepID=UPI003307C037